jgi:hypothetical protein
MLENIHGQGSIKRRYLPRRLRYPTERVGEAAAISAVPKLMSSKLRAHIPSEIALKVPEAMIADPTDGTGVFFHRFEVPSYWILEVPKANQRESN